MSTFQEVTILGNIGHDVTIKHFEGGNCVANISVATSESYKDANGEKKELTEWHNVKAFGKQAEIIEKYVKKGDKFFCKGRLKTRTYESEGVKKSITEIVITEFKLLGN